MASNTPDTQPEEVESLSSVPKTLPWQANNDQLIKELITLIEREENQIVLCGKRGENEVIAYLCHD
jgi:hypothetical protein